jgi:hypothetical protein
MKSGFSGLCLVWKAHERANNARAHRMGSNKMTSL